jgi:signal transduction histidine kinase
MAQVAGTIVRGVVDAHGGQLQFEQGSDGGLRVTIRLPEVNN